MTESLEDLSAVVKSKVQKLEDKLAKAKFIMERIVEMKSSGNYLSSQQMETIRDNSSKKVEKQTNAQSK